MGFMDSLFKAKDTAPTYGIAADPYGSVREPMLNWLKGQIGQSAPQYQGQLVAPMTTAENRSMSALDDFANRPQSNLRTLANQEVSKTLSGNYDPSTSPYYQAVKAEAARNLADAQSNIASNAAGGGRYWTGARLGEQGAAATDTAIGLNNVLGQLADSERTRQMQAARLANTLASGEDNAALQKVSALQTYGSLPREIQQNLNNATYQEWLRATQEYPLQIAQLASGLLKEPYYVQNQQQQSMFNKMLPLLGTAAGGLLGSIIPGVGTVIGAGLGGSLGSGLQGAMG